MQQQAQQQAQHQQQQQQQQQQQLVVVAMVWQGQEEGKGQAWQRKRACRMHCVGKETALFEPFLYKMHCFTKTGSGQT
jgi:hypothetical protein